VHGGAGSAGADYWNSRGKGGGEAADRGKGGGEAADRGKGAADRGKGAAGEEGGAADEGKRAVDEGKRAVDEEGGAAWCWHKQHSGQRVQDPPLESASRKPETADSYSGSEGKHPGSAEGSPG